MSMKDSWTVTTERMSVTLVSEPVKVPAGRARGLDPGDLPVIPAYVLVSRPGGQEPVRISGEDVELLMYVLSKLVGRQYVPMVGGSGAIIGA